MAVRHAQENRKVPTDFMDSGWVDNVYKSMYKEPWYKSGKTMPRVPSYCDRILCHTLPGSESFLHPERVSQARSPPPPLIPPLRAFLTAALVRVVLLFCSLAC